MASAEDKTTPNAPENVTAESIAPEIVTAKTTIHILPGLQRSHRE